MSDSREPPEQRSGDCQSSKGKIDSETHSGPNPDLNSNSFDSFISYTPSSMIDPVTVLLTSLQWLERVPCSFNIFMSRSFQAVRESRTVEGPMHHRSLWPVPPPLWRWTANPRPGPRQRRRRRKTRACHLLLQRLVCMLNWITLGYPDKPTSAARAGGTCSADQYKVLQNLQQQIDHFSDVAAFASQDLGRFGEKFSALKRSSEELPAHLEVDLEDLLHEIHSSLNHYTRFEKPHFADREQFSQQHAECKHEPSNVVSDSVGNKPVIASRIKWKHPPTFDARPYLLDPVVASVYERPDTLRLPVSEWPQKSKARVHCERGEFKELMKIWDAHGSLALFPTSEIDEQETVGLFAVPKDNEYDRLIVNPTVLNSRMAGYSNFTKKLAPGSLIALLSLEPDQCFRFNADDLSDFYYTFRVSRARAKRNAIGVRMFEKDVAGLSCYDPKTPGPYYPALATLAMGDGHAVEIAQGSHHALLQIEAGSMLDSESLEYRKPIPRGDFIELLAIDDHIGIQRVSRDQLISKTPLRDTEVFDRATSAYSRVGLVSHPGKQKRFHTQGTILGADFDGVRGIVSAPRSRILLLCLVTSLICSKGTCTRHLLNSLVGCWIHIILFRRPLLALMDAVFREGMDNKPHEVFCLSSQLRHELMSLCLLAPCAQADLRAAFCPRIYAMDASPWGGGIVYADSTSVATAELWRHSEQRGYHTNLLSPAAATLEELGFDSSGALAFGVPSNEHDNPSRPSHRIPRSLQEGILFDCVELFRGSGNWSQCHADIGLRVHDGFDNSGHRLFFKDLSDNATFREVISLALRRVVREFHAGPPCMTFGTLRRPRLRSVSKPEGFDTTDPLTALHNSLARRTAMIGAIAILTGAYFGCEQTGSSVMFRMHCFKVLIRLGCIITRMAFCNFGSGFNKPSQWLHNKGWLVEFEGNCQCKHKGKHFTIEGNFTERSILEFESRCVPNSSAVYGRKPRSSESVASYSAQYPVSLMRRMALGSLTALKEGPPIIPQHCRVLSMKRVGDHEEIPDSVFFPIDEEVPSRDWFEDPEWIGELADSLPFKTLFKYQFKESNHINVLESRVYGSWIKHCAKSHMHSRVVGLIDSRVTLGATSKGRSSSYAISRVLKKNIPYIIGSNLYPGGLHVYSKKNRADAPSRNREVEPPCRELPSWYHQLCAGNYRSFDIVCQSASVPRIIGRWLRLLLLMAGDIEPHPGPSQKCRGELDMTVGFHPATADRMKKCLQAFETWVVESLGICFQSVMQQSSSAAMALRAYGLHLYRSGHPRYLLVYALTAVQDKFPQHRHFLGSAWQVNKKWEVAEPGHCRPVVSLPVLRGVLCTALLWNWPRFAAITMIAFAGMLHPAEFIQLERSDLMLPRDTCFTTKALYVHLKNPKTARFARQQHVKISNPDIIFFVDSLFAELPLRQKIFGASISAYRNQWNAIMKVLGVPFRQHQKGVTPGTLRGSGATQLYLMTENIPLISWRGRWARVRTLEFYLQEVAAQVLLHSLSPKSRILIQKTE